MSTAKTARFRPPSAAPKPGFSPMAPPKQSLAHIVRLEDLGWSRDATDPDVEFCRLVAHYSDGSTREVSQTVTYPRGRREEIIRSIVEGISSGTGEQAAVAVLRARSLVRQHLIAKARSVPFVVRA